VQGVQRPPEDEDAEEAWRQEIFRRLQQIDSGAVQLIPWEDAERRLWATRLSNKPTAC
jgi:putative addiction module component (TIGR02574 family)